MRITVPSLAVVVLLLPTTVLAQACGGGQRGEPSVDQLYSSRVKDRLAQVQAENARIYSEYQDHLSDMIAIAEGVDFAIGTVVSLVPYGSQTYSLAKSLTFVVMGETTMATQSLPTTTEVALSLATAPLGDVGAAIGGAVDASEAVSLGQEIGTELAD